MLIIGILSSARLDFGFGNPNTAGALFAALAIAVWGIRGFAGTHSFWFWVLFAASAAFAELAILTASRGALAALLAGGLAAWGAAGFPRGSARKIGLLCVIIFTLGLLAANGRMGVRLAKNPASDGSITSRLAIYRALPAMMAAAPAGWGSGKSASAYENWFQAREDIRRYKHLISTHATWLVEGGWGFRLMYISAWCVVLAICLASPVSFGIWVCWGVASTFSHVGADWRLWIVPALAFLAALCQRFKNRNWPSIRFWICCAGGAGTGLLALVVLGHMQNQSPGIHFDGATMMVGGGAPSLWFFIPDEAVLGQDYGKTLREMAPLALTSDFTVLAEQHLGQIIFSGRAALAEGITPKEPYDLIWLNPPANLAENQKRLLERANRKIVIWGEMRTDADSLALRTWLASLPNAQWKDAPGKGLYLWNIAALLR